MNFRGFSGCELHLCSRLGLCGGILCQQRLRFLSSKVNLNTFHIHVFRMITWLVPIPHCNSRADKRQTNTELSLHAMRQFVGKLASFISKQVNRVAAALMRSSHASPEECIVLQENNGNFAQIKYEFFNMAYKVTYSGSCWLSKLSDDCFNWYSVANFVCRTEYSDSLSK